ncbi:MAG: O-antigen ligase family protein [Armatimonadota bacterium]|nr:O-antigen ligase family protein [bacterium]
MAIVAYTVLIQLPELREATASRFALLGFWVIALLICALVAKIRRSLVFTGLLTCVLAFDCYSILLEIIKDSGYTISPLFYNINLTLLFLLVGYLVSTLITPLVMLRICKTYALAVLVITPYFIKNYFSLQHIFTSKNSLGPIIVYAAIIVTVIFHFQSRLANFIKWSVVVWLIACVFMLINRASIASIVVLTLYYILYCLPTLKKKLIAIIVLVVFFGVCLSNSTILQTLQFATRMDLVSGGMDEFSSGRVTIFDDVKQQFTDSPIVGVGQLYVENFHSSVLVQVGILGSIPVFLIYLYPIWSFALNRYRVNDDILARLIALMTVHGVVISCFEEQAPFGQGSTYFILWLMIGYYIGYNACCRTSPLPAPVAVTGEMR